jgi:hypothetical protein
MLEFLIEFVVPVLVEVGLLMFPPLVATTGIILRGNVSEMMII